ncbi:hypothetical protein [Lacticaseibacillus daqingensis]|uniref:hypothetical protein n=1 Tax=Lacticaseibacillus daqingensis TaxID=2486014 RepID=UPI000F796DEC|nr:hypothetical protein [Lacticaseibacillus daqingensis]
MSKPRSKRKHRHSKDRVTLEVQVPAGVDPTPYLTRAAQEYVQQMMDAAMAQAFDQAKAHIKKQIDAEFIPAFEAQLARNLTGASDEADGPQATPDRDHDDAPLPGAADDNVTAPDEDDWLEDEQMAYGDDWDGLGNDD